MIEIIKEYHHKIGKINNLGVYKEKTIICIAKKDVLGLIKKRIECLMSLRIAIGEIDELEKLYKEIEGKKE